MKPILFLISTILFSNLSVAQAPSIVWEKSLGGISSDQAFSIQQTSEGGYIVAGISTSFTSGSMSDWSDCLVVKLSSTGAITWQKTFGGKSPDSGNSIRQTSDGGYIVAGSSASNDGDVTGNHGSRDLWIVKLNNIGVITWQKSLGGTGSDSSPSLELTSDGGFIVAGRSSSNNGDVSGNHGESDYWVVKLDSLGVITWQKSLGGSSIELVNFIEQTSDGGYIVAGSSESNDGDVTGNHENFDMWIVKLDSSGAMTWQKSLGGTGIDRAYSVRQTSNNEFIVVGSTESNDGDVTGNHGGRDAWLVKLNSIGSILWQKSIGGIGTDQIYSIQQSSDDGYIVTGYSSSSDGDMTNNNGAGDMWVAKIDNTGTITWQKSYGGTGPDFGSFITETTDGGCIIAGQSNSRNGDVTGNHGDSDMWIVKLSTLVEINETENLLKYRMFPNPTNGKISIDLGVKFNNIKAILTNDLGQIVLAKNYTSTNFVNIDIDATSGIYFLQLETTDGVTRTLKILKK
jgi:hypothetical protein